jgi:pyruvate/2-oxoacid:ferredoxin oxidoreductase beta subunit
MKMDLGTKEFLHPGHAFCPGCGFTIGLRTILKVLGEDTVAAITAGCLGTNSGLFPSSPIKIAAYNTPFESAAAAASGIRAALDMKGKGETNVIAIAGDGGTFDIGLQALSAAAERNENFIFLCYDNEGYMNTGIQKSSATPWGAWTTTTPRGMLKSSHKKNLAEMMALHRVPYVATACIAYPEDLVRKVEKAKTIQGLRFLHLLASCPSGWKFSPEKTVRVARLAVETRTFPLYEVMEGERYELSLDPGYHPVREYIQAQGRFQYLTDHDIDGIQQEVDRSWERLLAKTAPPKIKKPRKKTY